jgi:hypothetical protein
MRVFCFSKIFLLKKILRGGATSQGDAGPVGRSSVDQSEMGWGTHSMVEDKSEDRG